MESSAGDDINIRPTVLLVLSRLQQRRVRNAHGRTGGVSSKNIAEFLKANVPWVDGDVDSQVLTVLLTCVKDGLVCALGDGKYRLVELNSKNMMSNCETRISHGSRCCCLQLLKNFLRSFRQPCCSLKRKECYVKRGGNMSRKSEMRGRKRKCGQKRKPEVKCAQYAQREMGTSRSNEVLRRLKQDEKCNYCLEIHSMPKSRRTCMTCYPSASGTTPPRDTFSPRDELKSDEGSED